MAHVDVVTAAEETNNFLVPNGTFFVELVAFAIIFCILAKYVIPPINKAMTARQDAIRQEFAEAEEAKDNATQAESDFKSQLADARKEAARIREEAREQGNGIIAEAKEQAQVEAQRVKEQAQAQIAAERQQALTSLRAEVGTLATSLAGRIVGESLDDDERSGRVVDRFLADLESLETSEDSASSERGAVLMLRGASAEALAELSQQATRTQTLDDAATLGTNLFGVASVVGRDAALRRALTDASVEGEARSGLAKAVFGTSARRPGDAPGRGRRRAAAGSAARTCPTPWSSSRSAATVRSAGAKGKQVGDELFAVRPDDRGQPVAARCAGRPLAHRRGPQRAAPRSPRRQDPPGDRRARGAGRDPGARDRRACPRGVPRPGRGRPRGGGRHGDHRPRAVSGRAAAAGRPRSASSTARTSSCTWSSTRR